MLIDLIVSLCMFIVGDGFVHVPLVFGTMVILVRCGYSSQEIYRFGLYVMTQIYIVMQHSKARVAEKTFVA